MVIHKNRTDAGKYPGDHRPRLRRHTIAAGIVASYLLAAVVAAIAHGGWGLPLWLALHLLVLGAATNAVFVWSWHFAEALLHARPASARPGYLRLAVLNAGIAAVLAGVSTSVDGLAVAGAALVIVAVSWLVAGLARLAHGSVLPGRLREVVWYYLAAGVALALGAALGGVLATDVVRSQRLDAAFRLTHAHLNLLGWLGLAILGTEFMLWPAVLRTRMAGDAPMWARRVLVVTVSGLAVTAVGLLSTAEVMAARWVAVAGMLVYGAGVAGSLVPAVREMRARPPRSAAAWALVAGNAWLLAGVLTDAVALAAGPGHADRMLTGSLIPVLALGVVAQILTGALTFLLPVVAGGGPAGNRRLTEVLERGWPARAAATNAGVLLLALPAAGPVRLAGWLLVLAGLGPFPFLVAAALSHRPRQRDRLCGMPGRSRAGVTPAGITRSRCGPARPIRTIRAGRGLASLWAGRGLGSLIRTVSGARPRLR